MYKFLSSEYSIYTKEKERHYCQSGRDWIAWMHLVKYFQTPGPTLASSVSSETCYKYVIKLKTIKQYVSNTFYPLSISSYTNMTF